MRRFRGAEYRICISNPDGVSKGVASLRMNGEALNSALVPAAPAGSVNQVEVVMGKD